MKKYIPFLINPFEQIAGYQALAWGLFGMLLSTILSWLSGWHYHGLLHFGPASNSALWCYAVEHITVWFIPSIIFYMGGLILSRSRIRFIDVLGTIAFAQLPLLIKNGIEFLPPLQQLVNMDMSPLEMTQQAGYKTAIWLSLITIIFLIWTLNWMLKALRVSCHLSGYKLGILYFITICGGEMLIRYLIRMCY